jgi:hypothetical protein
MKVTHTSSHPTVHRISDLLFTVSYYQPETTFEIFNRVLFNRDVATGRTSTAPTSNSSTYATTGNSTALVSIGAPIKFESDAPSCYLWDIMETCTPAQVQIFKNGSAITEDFILVGYSLKDGTKVFYNQTGGTGGGKGSGNGSAPQRYVPGSGALHTSAINLGLAVLAAAIVAVVV